MLPSADREGRAMRYVHQENHHKSSTDSRGGVYPEARNTLFCSSQEKFHTVILTPPVKILL